MLPHITVGVQHSDHNWNTREILHQVVCSAWSPPARVGVQHSDHNWNTREILHQVVVQLSDHNWNTPVVFHQFIIWILGVLYVLVGWKEFSFWKETEENLHNGFTVCQRNNELWGGKGVWGIALGKYVQWLNNRWPLRLYLRFSLLRNKKTPGRAAGVKGISWIKLNTIPYWSFW